MANICQILASSAILDARFKQLKFLEDTQKYAIIDALKSDVERMVDDQDCTMVDDIECKSNELGSSQLAVAKAEGASSSIMDSQVVLDEVGIPVAKRSKISLGYFAWT